LVKWPGSLAPNFFFTLTYFEANSSLTVFAISIIETQWGFLFRITLGFVKLFICGSLSGYSQPAQKSQENVMANILIDWKAFTPTEETKKQTESILQTLKYVLPPESDIKICIERFNKNFEGHVVVRSPLGDFAAHGEAKDLFSLCKNLRKNLKQQIFKHRETRHQWNRAS
jgi:ribosome-associated translation inhibitor RaiA